MTIAWIVLGIVAIGCFVVWMVVLENKRSEALASIAEEMGFNYLKKGDKSHLDRFQSFHLFSQGHSKKIKNHIFGSSQGLELGLFGYEYTTGAGKDSHTHRQSVFYIVSPEIHVSAFSLRPEHIFHRIGKAFGYQDIEIESHPEFSKQFLLRGKEVDKIKNLFTQTIMDHYVSIGKVSTEGAGDTLVFYRSGKRIKPDMIQSFIDEGLSIYKLFHKSVMGKTET